MIGARGHAGLELVGCFEGATGPHTRRSKGRWALRDELEPGLRTVGRDVERLGICRRRVIAGAAGEHQRGEADGSSRKRRRVEPWPPAAPISLVARAYQSRISSEIREYLSRVAYHGATIDLVVEAPHLHVNTAKGDASPQSRPVGQACAIVFVAPKGVPKLREHERRRVAAVGSAV